MKMPARMAVVTANKETSGVGCVVWRDLKIGFMHLRKFTGQSRIIYVIGARKRLLEGILSQVGSRDGEVVLRGRGGDVVTQIHAREGALRRKSIRFSPI